MNALSSNPYYKKTVSYNYRGRHLDFQVSQSLFSSQDIDNGTKHLLKTFSDQKVDNYQKVLDLGCGYGPIGIALKSYCPGSEIHMVDKDALALKFALSNTTLNNFDNLKIYGSLGYDDVHDKDFDLIASNVPAKVGETTLSHILLDGQYHMRPHGIMVIVVIKPIGEIVNKILGSSRNVRIVFHKKWPEHWVYYYEFLSTNSQDTLSERKSFEMGIYDRYEKTLSIGGSHVLIKTTYNLPEFDTLSYETELFLNSLKIMTREHINRVTIFKPGQGYIPVAVSKLMKVDKIDLVDRDLQELRISARNLILNGYPENNINVSHQVGIQKGTADLSGLIVGTLLDKDGPDVHTMLLYEATLQLASNGLIIFTSSSTGITRIISLVNSEKKLSIVERQKARGVSVVFLRKKL